MCAGDTGIYRNFLRGGGADEWHFVAPFQPCWLSTCSSADIVYLTCKTALPYPSIPQGICSSNLPTSGGTPPKQLSATPNKQFRPDWCPFTVTPGPGKGGASPIHQNTESRLANQHTAIVIGSHCWQPVGALTLTSKLAAWLWPSQNRGFT